MTSQHEFQPSLLSPNTVGAIGWMKKYLFSTQKNFRIVFILPFIVFEELWTVIKWAFINFDWVGSTHDACSYAGVCWVFINVRFE